MKLSREQAKQLGLVPAKSPGVYPIHLEADKAAAAKAFDAACVRAGLPVPDHEYQFAPPRRWRADYVFDGWLIVERVGGVWNGGHHTGGQDQIDDMERRNEAQIAGYAVLEFTPQQLDSGAALDVIRRALAGGCP